MTPCATGTVEPPPPTERRPTMKSRLIEWQALDDLNEMLEQGATRWWTPTLIRALQVVLLQQNAALKAMARGCTLDFPAEIRPDESAAFRKPRHIKPGRHIEMDIGSRPMEIKGPSREQMAPPMSAGAWDNAVRAYENRGDQL